MYHFELKPNRTHNQWEREFEKLFDVFSKEDLFAPACEILDEEKSYMISLDIPGASREDINIEVKDNHLYISGERKYNGAVKQDYILRSERRYGKFSRVFSLPKNVNPDAIEARFENGVLDLTLPKEERSQTRKISISGWKKEAATDLKS